MDRLTLIIEDIYSKKPYGQLSAKLLILCNNVYLQYIYFLVLKLKLRDNMHLILIPSSVGGIKSILLLSRE